MAGKTTEVANIEQGKYLPITVEGFNWKEVIEENLGGQAPGAFDLPRIRIPSGGGIAWTVPTLEGPDAQKTLTGVIVAWQTMRGYWAIPFDQSGAGTPPDCSSNDGEIGIGKPGGDCATCPLNQFGSGKDNSKACKEVRMLFLYTEGAILPVAVPLAPMSIKPCKQYFLGLASEKRKPYFTVETTLGLEQAKNANGITYAKATFKFNRELTAAEEGYIREYRLQFTPIMEAKAALRQDELES